jgi:hypothetical protein
MFYSNFEHPTIIGIEFCQNKDDEDWLDEILISGINRVKELFTYEMLSPRKDSLA